MDQDSEATELLGHIITTVHWVLVQYLSVAKQSSPYIVHGFFQLLLLAGKEKVLLT